MLCSKFELIPTSIFRVMAILRKHQNFEKNPCTIVQGLLSDFGATLKNRKKFKSDRNQLKLSTQHKYMYMY